MKKLLIIAVVTFLSVSVSHAQTQNEIGDRSDWQDRIFTGGNVGFQFGTITNINLSPTLGYRITNAFSAGVGVSYVYQKFASISRTHYGGNVFARYNITQQFFAMTQYESLSIDVGGSRRIGLNSFMVGGGIQQPLGGNAVASFTVLYNLSYDETKPTIYDSPIVIGGGITLGF
ncbi:MAG: hypothetical protein JXQ96_16575 [Cyclobacteriaceae bacterium]